MVVYTFSNIANNPRVQWLNLPFTSSVWLSNRSNERTIQRTSMLESTRELLIWVRNTWNWGKAHCLTKDKQRLLNNGFYFSTFCYSLYLFLCVDIFVESLEGINVELHKLSEQVKVALQDISGLAAAVDDAKEDVLQSKDKIWATQSLLWGKTFWPIREAQAFV